MYSRVRLMPFKQLSQVMKVKVAAQQQQYGMMMMNYSSAARKFSTATVSEPRKSIYNPDPTDADLMSKHRADVLFPDQMEKPRAWKTVLVVNYTAMDQYDMFPHLRSTIDPEPILAKDGVELTATAGIKPTDTYLTNSNVLPTRKEIWEVVKATYTPRGMAEAWRQGRFAAVVFYPIATFIIVGGAVVWIGMKPFELVWGSYQDSLGTTRRF